MIPGDTQIASMLQYKGSLAKWPGTATRIHVMIPGDTRIASMLQYKGSLWKWPLVSQHDLNSIITVEMRNIAILDIFANIATSNDSRGRCMSVHISAHVYSCVCMCACVCVCTCVCVCVCACVRVRARACKYILFYTWLHLRIVVDIAVFNDSLGRVEKIYCGTPAVTNFGAPNPRFRVFAVNCKQWNCYKKTCIMKEIYYQKRREKERSKLQW